MEEHLIEENMEEQAPPDPQDERELEDEPAPESVVEHQTIQTNLVIPDEFVEEALNRYIAYRREHEYGFNWLARVSRQRDEISQMTHSFARVRKGMEDTVLGYQAEGMTRAELEEELDALYRQGEPLSRKDALEHVYNGLAELLRNRGCEITHAEDNHAFYATYYTGVSICISFDGDVTVFGENGVVLTPGLWEVFHHIRNYVNRAHYEADLNRT